MPAHRIFTRRQVRENEAFLEALRQTGNARLAARMLGVHRSTYTKRRAKDAAFAARWEMMLAAANAAFRLAGGPRAPEPPKEGTVASRRADFTHASYTAALRTEGGEPTVVRRADGRLQLRLAPPGRMTKAAEQVFFRALAASANIRLAAACTGFAAATFYARANASKAFAREKRLALAMGYDRLEQALLASGVPESREDDAWRCEGELAPIPPMTANQALQLLMLHNKEVRLGWDRPHRRKRRNEPWETYTERLRAMWTREKDREAEDDAVARAARYETSGDWRFAAEAALPPLPPLEQVTGWSKANRAKPAHNPDLALFGGWRLRDWQKRKAASG